MIKEISIKLNLNDKNLLNLMQMNLLYMLNLKEWNEMSVS